MQQMNLRQMVLIGMTCTATLLAGVIGAGLAIETSVIAPPVLNVQLGSIALVSFPLPHDCLSQRLCSLADQADPYDAYAIWLFVSSDASTPPHAIELVRIPLVIHSISSNRVTQAIL